VPVAHCGALGIVTRSPSVVIGVIFLLAVCMAALSWSDVVKHPSHIVGARYLVVLGLTTATAAATVLWSWIRPSRPSLVIAVLSALVLLAFAVSEWCA
jgi:hypothetical protein